MSKATGAAAQRSGTPRDKAGRREVKTSTPRRLSYFCTITQIIFWTFTYIALETRKGLSGTGEDEPQWRTLLRTMYEESAYCLTRQVTAPCTKEKNKFTEASDWSGRTAGQETGRCERIDSPKKTPWIFDALDRRLREIGSRVNASCYRLPSLRASIAWCVRTSPSLGSASRRADESTCAPS